MICGKMSIKKSYHATATAWEDLQSPLRFLFSIPLLFQRLQPQNFIHVGLRRLI